MRFIFKGFTLRGGHLAIAKLSWLSVVTLMCTVICHTFERRKTKQKIAHSICTYYSTFENMGRFATLNKIRVQKIESKK